MAAARVFAAAGAVFAFVVLPASAATPVSTWRVRTAARAQPRVTATVGSSTVQAKLAASTALDPLTVTTSSLGDSWLGTPYSQALQASGGTPPYTWSITSGTLPDGLSLDSGTGVISGTHQTSTSCAECDAVDDLTVQVTDHDGQTASASVPLLVAYTPPPCTSGCSLQAALSGSPNTPDASGGTDGIIVTSPQHVPGACWRPYPGGTTYPDGSPTEYTNQCTLVAASLNASGQPTAPDQQGGCGNNGVSYTCPYGAIAEPGGNTVAASDNQDPSTLATFGPAQLFNCDFDCLGDVAWLELWVEPPLASPSLLDISNEVSVPGQSAPISGTVTNKYGKPLPGVKVEIKGSQGTDTATTGASGRYTKFEPPGTYTVTPQPNHQGLYTPQSSSECTGDNGSCDISVTTSAVEADFVAQRLPVVLTTGLSDSHNGMTPGGDCLTVGSMATICTTLQDAGFPVYVPRAQAIRDDGTVITHSGAVRPNAFSLAQYLTTTVGGAALLVGHSMGGLFSRDAIGHYGAKAAGLFTIGTPFAGSYGADIAEADSQAQCASGLAGASCRALKTAAEDAEDFLGAAAVADLTAASRLQDNMTLGATGVPTWTVAGTACSAVTLPEVEDPYVFPNDGIVGQASAYGEASLYSSSANLGPTTQSSIDAYHSATVQHPILEELFPGGDCLESAPVELETVGAAVLKAATQLDSTSAQPQLRANAARDQRGASRKPTSFTVTFQTLTVRAVRPGETVPVASRGFVSAETPFQLRCPHTAPVQSQPVLGSSKLSALPGAAFKCRHPSLTAAKPVTAIIASDPSQVRAKFTPTRRGYTITITARHPLSQIVLERNRKRVHPKLHWHTRRSVSLSLATTPTAKIAITATADHARYSARLH